LPEKEELILEESTLVHKSGDQLRLKTLQDEQYMVLEGDEDRVFKDVRAATPQDGLFDIQELAQIFGPHTWLSLYGHWLLLPLLESKSAKNAKSTGPTPLMGISGNDFYVPYEGNLETTQLVEQVCCALIF
jgi:hypothetical protein